MSRPPGGAVADVVPIERVLAAYDALRAEHRRRRWAPPTQLELAASLTWSEQTLRRYLHAHDRRWPGVRGADLEFLEGSCQAASAERRAS